MNFYIKYLKKHKALGGISFGDRANLFQDSQLIKHQKSKSYMDAIYGQRGELIIKVKNFGRKLQFISLDFLTIKTCKC